jgi:AcrR family transcriptional regulator
MVLADDPPKAPRRAVILRAASELFARRGFHGVSVGELGGAAGLTGPALYRHFRSKEAVLAEMLLDISGRLLEEGERRAETAASPQAALTALVIGHVDFSLDNPALITVHERELDNVPEPERRQVRQLQRAYVEIWVRVLCAARPGLEDDRARAAVHAAFGLLNSTPKSSGTLEREAMARMLVAMAGAALASA